MIPSASKQIRYRKQKRWMGYVLFIVLMGGVGAFLFPWFPEKFFPAWPKLLLRGVEDEASQRGEQKWEREEISQARWLYWCAGSMEAEERPCYYVDREGLFVDEAPQLKGTLFPKLYDEREGEKRVEERLLAFVRHFYDLGQFVVKNDETLEIGWPNAMKIKTTLIDDPKKIAENLALILEKEIGNRRDEVDYIDLRFGNRVYYKFR